MRNSHLNNQIKILNNELKNNKDYLEKEWERRFLMITGLKVGERVVCRFSKNQIGEGYIRYTKNGNIKVVRELNVFPSGTYYNMSNSPKTINPIKKTQTAKLDKIMF